jgi:hypothetical protein
MNKVLAHLLIGIVTVLLLPVQIIWFVILGVFVIITFIISFVFYIIFKILTGICMIDTEKYDFDDFLEVTEIIMEKMVFLADVRLTMGFYLIEHPEYILQIINKNKYKNDNKK